MKLNTLLFMLMMSLLTTAVIISCQEDIPDSVSPADELKNEEEFKLLPAEAGWYPEGSDVYYNDFGDLVINASEEWAYVGLGTDGITRIEIEGEVTINCQCTAGTGCDPYYTWINHCCRLKTSCTKCTKSLTTTGPSGNNDGIVLYNKVTKGGFINPGAGVTFNDGNKDLPMAFNEMFDLPLVNAGLEKFLRENNLEELINGEPNPERNYITIPINIFGRYAVLDIPEERFSENGGSGLPEYIQMSDGVEITCSCTEGICPKKINGFTTYCDSAKCTGVCSMTIHTTIANGGLADMEVKSYRY